MVLNCKSFSSSDNPHCQHLLRLHLWSSFCIRPFFHTLDCTSFRTCKTCPVWLYNRFEESELVHINITFFLPLGTVAQILCIRNNARAFLPRILFLFVENEAEWETEVHVFSLITYVQAIAFSGSTFLTTREAGEVKGKRNVYGAKRYKNNTWSSLYRAQTSTFCHIRKLWVLLCLPLHTLHLALDMFASENISAWTWMFEAGLLDFTSRPKKIKCTHGDRNELTQDGVVFFPTGMECNCLWNEHAEAGCKWVLLFWLQE